MAKSFQPAVQPMFSSDIQVTPSHSPPATIPKDSEPFFHPPTGRTGTDSSAIMHQPASPDLIFNYPQGALERASLLLSICHPASSDPTDRTLPHQSALVPTPLLSISPPASLNPTDTGLDHHHLGTLAWTHLFLNTSQPASLIQTGTDLVLTLLPPDMYLPAGHISTVLNLQWPPTPVHLHCIDRTVFLV